MSNLLEQKCSLAKLREELEERKGKLYRCCKKFRHPQQGVPTGIGIVYKGYSCVILSVRGM